MRGCTDGLTGPTRRADQAAHRRAQERRERVLREIERPVFSLLKHGPLYEKCTFLSYDAVEAIAGIKHLSHTNDTILNEYEEDTEDE